MQDNFSGSRHRNLVRRRFQSSRQPDKLTVTLSTCIWILFPVTVSLCFVTILFSSFKYMPCLLSLAVDWDVLVIRLIVLSSSWRRGDWYSSLGRADNDVGFWVPLSFPVVGVDASDKGWSNLTLLPCDWCCPLFRIIAEIGIRMVGHLIHTFLWHKLNRSDSSNSFRNSRVVSLATKQETLGDTWAYWMTISFQKPSELREITYVFALSLSQHTQWLAGSDWPRSLILLIAG